jgi:hypothetical protein
LDQITVTIFALTFAFLTSASTLSAYSRKSVEEGIALSTYSGIALIAESGSFGSRQITHIALAALGWFSIAFYNAIHKVSVSTELAFLKDGVDASDNASFLVRLSPILFNLACYSTLLLALRYRRRLGLIGERILGLAKIFIIGSHIFQFYYLHLEYRPYVRQEGSWSFGQVLPQIFLLIPLLSGYGRCALN